MPDDSFDDDYVAELLRQDAKAQSASYLRTGVRAFLPQRALNNAPKPNTRFLRNIIRETDNHNAALKAREAVESRARLKALRSKRPSGIFSYSDGLEPEVDCSNPRKRPRLSDSEEASRNDGNRKSKGTIRAANETSRARERHGNRRKDDLDDSNAEGSERERSTRRSRRKGRRDDPYDSGHDERRSRRDDISSEEDRRSRRSRRRKSGNEDGHRRARRRHEGRRDSRERTSSSKLKTERRERKRPESPASTSSASPPPGVRKSKRRSPSHRRSRSPSLLARAGPSDPINARTNMESTGSDSDPLDALIGPALPAEAPKVRSKGRGAFKSSLAIEDHFAPDYDPSMDIRIESEGEDEWGQAVEAFRDRVRWRQQGADRLRAAGFSENVVQKWEKGGEKTEEDVTWSKKGEGREWDRGKVLDHEGQITLQAEWGRLKGT